MSKKNEKIIIPLIAVGLGILVGMIILLLSGKDIATLFAGLVKGLTGYDMLKAGSAVNLRYPGEFLVSTMPIILTGLSISFAYRTGMFNIGCEGQVIMGSLVSCMVAILVPMPNFIAVVVCIIVGGIAGALWAFIPGLLKSKFNISEVVTGIMLNYTALYGANYFLRALPGSSAQRTVNIPENAMLGSELFKQITNNSRFHWGFIIVIIAVVLFWFIIEKTSFGYSLRATGFNKEGARYAGIKVNKSIILSIMISGFLAGIAGAIVVQGTFGYGRVMVAMDNYGFDGIAVALVGGCTALGVTFAGMLFGLLKVTQPLLQTFGVPKEIGEIISSSIVFFVALQYAIQYYLLKFTSGKKKKKQELQPQGGDVK
ncbi:ABC transporter permease [Anaerorhabdus furcosa]|uniref:Nucleoside ABC transporter membrane protein n=1 Tax=Anaerorhabdus furcosa TaxID=118967 RepID=A0A1T4NHW8_9FIRM|nr:ABC transporter permease [Anaerorhabdus furcosa]SJZ78368.1 nucleoside ABC transporter membrane protein [Anaerorhabdus furcosa]